MSGSALVPLDWPDGEFAYAAQAWSMQEADALFEVLRGQLAWTQHRIRMFGRDIVAPRVSAWHGDAQARYRYSGATYEPLPWTAPLSQARERVQQLAGRCFNAVLANRYRDGADAMGWHADDEPELGSEPAIASASFGAERRFVLRHRGSGRREEIALAHGSLLLMAGRSQRCWQHALPRTRRVVGERINLTFRNIVAPAVNAHTES